MLNSIVFIGAGLIVIIFIAAKFIDHHDNKESSQPNEILNETPDDLWLA